MSKIICDICGTSYSETSQQCPICGCVRPGDVQSVASEVKAEGDTATGYTHVKGGRFSKSNVNRRNKKKVDPTASQKPEQKTVAQEKAKEPKASPKQQEKKPEKKKETKTNAGLVVTVILLLLAIIAVVAFLAVRLFAPMITPPTDPTEDPTTGPTAGQEILCTNIKLDIETVTFQQAGDGRLLSVTTVPANTTETVTFRSENEAVATVTADGKITAVAKGQTKIIITCGSIVKECTVNCDIADVLCQDLVLSFETVTFVNAGDNAQLQVTIQPENAIETVTFSSENEAIATVTADGKITAVAKGQTKIIISCGSVVKECTVICNIEEKPDPTQPTEPVETIHLNREDFTLFYAGDAWTLYDGTVAKNLVTFTSDDENVVTFIDGKVVAVGPGTTFVHATYGDQKLSCKVFCSFKNGGSGGVAGSGGVGEDTDNVTYAIHTQYGKIYDRYGEYGWDITIRAGDVVYLYLKDSNGNTVTGTWTISGTSCTLADNKVTGATAGSESIISITHNEKTYTCKVRVV